MLLGLFLAALTATVATTLGISSALASETCSDVSAHLQRINRENEAVPYQVERDAQIKEYIITYIDQSGSLHGSFLTVATLLNRDYIPEIAKIEGGTSIAYALSSSFAAVDNSSQRRFGISGGFLGSYRTKSPAGFVQLNGIVDSLPIDPEQDEILSGLVCVSPSGALELSRITSDLYEKLMSTSPNVMLRGSCLQAGPMLLENGRASLPLHFEEDRAEQFWFQSYSRTFIATSRDDELLLGIASPVPLTVMSCILSQIGGVREAVNLHGATNAAFMVRDNGSVVYQRGNVTAVQATIVMISRR